MAPSAFASSASVSIIADNPPPPAVPDRPASTYTINFTCSAVVGSTLRPNPTITVPLDLTSEQPGHAGHEHLAYAASSSNSGLIAERRGRRRELRDRARRVRAQPGDSRHDQAQRHAAEQHHPGRDHLVADAHLPDRPDRRGAGPGARAGQASRGGAAERLEDDQRRRRRLRARQQRDLQHHRALQRRRAHGQPVPDRRQPRRHAAQPASSSSRRRRRPATAPRSAVSGTVTWNYPDAARCRAAARQTAPAPRTTRWSRRSTRDARQHAS